MALGKSAAVVIGSFDLGESDRVITFYSREYGKVRGVAKASRRMRSRFGGALELFTLGELVFFDTGRSELVRVDHFDVTHPFAGLRENLEVLGEAAWIVEVVARTTGEHDRQPALYGLLVRALRAMEVAPRPLHPRGAPAVGSLWRAPMTAMDTLVSLCKRRGFVFQSSEIYGGTGSCWDYGPLGVELKQNIKRVWWRDFVQERPDMVGLDASILMHATVWKASGHVDNFSDPMVDCRECKRRFRADQIDET